MKLTKAKLQKLIQEELGSISEEEDWGMGKDEKSRTRPGEEDYTGHKGDDSRSHPGERDYEGDKKIKSIGELAKALSSHGISGPDFEAWESGNLRGVSESSLTIDTDLGQARIQLYGPGGAKWGA